MNSIVRIVLRGLLSGEIKPDPQVFEYLRELSDRQLQRHSRILRMVRPAKVGVGCQALHRSDEPPGGEKPSQDPSRERTPRLSESSTKRRDWPAFASVSCGRWIRVVACMLFAVGVLGFGVLEVHASAPVAAGDPSTVVATHFVEGVTAGLISGLHMLHPFPGTLPIVSGAVLISLLAGSGWRWFCRHKLFAMRPYEVALQELESTPHRAAQGRIWNSRRAVLSILYDYIEAQFQLHIPGLRRDAFLRVLTLQGGPLTCSQRALLRDVLETPIDEPTTHPEQVADLSEKAASFVWATAGYRTPKGPVLHPALQGL